MSKPLIDNIHFSHGTLELRDAEKTQRFYREFLGLHSVHKNKRMQYVWLGGEWIIACAARGEAMRDRQEIDNRWGLEVATPEEVDAAYKAALAQQAQWGILDVRPITTEGGARAFCLQDMDGNWWEIYHRPGHIYDDLFEKQAAVAAA
jgi:catechol 2,3-dioxygenase-like lactoylglutathione lyase family enzyme